MSQILNKEEEFIRKTNRDWHSRQNTRGLKTGRSTTQERLQDCRWEGRRGRVEVDGSKTLAHSAKGSGLYICRNTQEEAGPDLNYNKNIRNIHTILHLGIPHSEFSLGKNKQLRIFWEEVISLPPSHDKKGSMT